MSSNELRKGDIVLVRENEMIPGDGEVIEGVAYVNEAAITGESAPVLKEPGTDIRTGVTGGTQVVSDWLKILSRADPGETFLDRIDALVEGAKRQKTPNEIAPSDDSCCGGLSIILPWLSVFRCSRSQCTGGPFTTIVPSSPFSSVCFLQQSEPRSAIGIGGHGTGVTRVQRPRDVRPPLVETSGDVTYCCGTDRARSRYQPAGGGGGPLNGGRAPEESVPRRASGRRSVMKPLKTRA